MTLIWTLTSQCRLLLESFKENSRLLNRPSTCPGQLYPKQILEAVLLMITHEQVSPSEAVSAPLAIDVSPVIIAPRDGKSSSFNPPGCFLPALSPHPLPSERLGLDRSHPVEESPLTRRHTSRGPKMATFAHARTTLNEIVS
jgi:hypothetical protein